MALFRRLGHGCQAKLAWLPLALLLGVALTHVYRVEVFHLTPWKGGGFGMFSTLDGLNNRRLLVSLVRHRTGEKQGVPVELPRDGKLRQLVNKTRAMPTTERLQILADEIAKQPWRVTDTREPDGVNEARLITDPSKQAHTRLVTFQEVVVTVVKLGVDREGTKLLPTAELTRTVSATRPGAQSRPGVL
jgi:hypothetical protein